MYLTGLHRHTLSPYGRGWKKVPVVPVVYKPFYREKNILFLLRVLSMYLTGLHRHTCRLRAWMESKD